MGQAEMNKFESLLADLLQVFGLGLFEDLGFAFVCLHGGTLRAGGQIKLQVQDLWPVAERFGERLAAREGRIGGLGEA